MLLHLVIAAALLAPGATSRVAASHAAAVVCSIVGVDLQTSAREPRSFGAPARAAAWVSTASAPRAALVRPTNQLRR